MISTLPKKFYLGLTSIACFLEHTSAAAIGGSPSPPAFCNVDPRWVTPHVQRADCMATVDMLYDIELNSRQGSWKEQEYEFVTPAVKRRTTTTVPRMDTPRKYTVGMFHPICSRYAKRKLTKKEPVRWQSLCYGVSRWTTSLFLEEWSHPSLPETRPPSMSYGKLRTDY